MKRVDGKLVYLPVQGPHLVRLDQRHKGSRTGVPGIGFTSMSCHPGGRRYSFFVAVTGKRKHRFNIATLGREEAWARALRCRAEYERGVIARNETILEGRKIRNFPTHPKFNIQHPTSL